MPSNPTRHAQERAALVALVRRIEEVGVRPGTDLAEAVAGAHAALAASETSEPPAHVSHNIEGSGCTRCCNVEARWLALPCPDAPAPVGEPQPSEAPARAKACLTCGALLAEFNPNNTATWRTDDFCSARCRRKRPKGASPS
jgi:hypothetical protein